MLNDMITGLVEMVLNDYNVHMDTKIKLNDLDINEFKEEITDTIIKLLEKK